MAGVEGAEGQQITAVQVEFYRGIKSIANFLELHPDTVRKLIRQAKIPAKKDEMGRWVLVNVDY